MRRAADEGPPIIAVGVSAGGLGALGEILSHLPAGFPAAVLIVQHLHPERRTLMPALLAGRTGMEVKQAEDGEQVRPGVVYLAPPDCHLLVADYRIRLTHTRRVHFSRPSIDLLFQSVAAQCARACIGVILTGANNDGAAGIAAIKQAGGTTISQSPATAEYQTMPRAAIATGCVDHILALGDIAGELNQLFPRSA
jgi:two-component system chemotaxis response regulator CheB